MRNSQPLVPAASPGQLILEWSERALGAFERHSVTALRVSIGIVFLWFGVLKYFPGASPAEDIAVQTIGALSLGLVTPKLALLGLATFESAVGLCFTLGVFRRYALPLLLLHMCGTALPFVFFPAETFRVLPFAPTFLGQYILKNMIIVSAALVLRRRWR